MIRSPDGRTSVGLPTDGPARLPARAPLPTGLGLGVLALATLTACVGSESPTAPSQSSKTGPAAVRIGPVSYELRLAAGGDALPDGAAVVAISGVVLDSVTASDGVVATLAGTVGSEARMIVAGALHNGAVVRLWGTGPQGAAAPTPVLREAVDGSTLDEATLDATVGRARALLTLRAVPASAPVGGNPAAP